MKVLMLRPVLYFGLGMPKAVEKVGDFFDGLASEYSDYFRLFSYDSIIFLTIWPPIEPACLDVRSPL